MMREIKVQDRAPDFHLPGHDGTAYKLSDYRGQTVVIAFFPSAFNPVCAEEHACFVDAGTLLDKMDAQVFGISVDQMWSLKAFAASHDIQYPLLSDFPRGMVGRQFGVFLDEHSYHARWTFVVDPEGRIAFIQKNELGEVPDVDEIVEAVKETI